MGQHLPLTPGRRRAQEGEIHQTRTNAYPTHNLSNTVPQCTIPGCSQCASADTCATCARGQVPNGWGLCNCAPGYGGVGGNCVKCAGGTTSAGGPIAWAACAAAGKAVKLAKAKMSVPLSYTLDSTQVGARARARIAQGLDQPSAGTDAPSDAARSPVNPPSRLTGRPGRRRPPTPPPTVHRPAPVWQRQHARRPDAGHDVCVAPDVRLRPGRLHLCGGHGPARLRGPGRCAAACRRTRGCTDVPNARGVVFLQTCLGGPPDINSPNTTLRTPPFQTSLPT